MAIGNSAEYCPVSTVSNMVTVATVYCTVTIGNMITVATVDCTVTR